MFLNLGPSFCNKGTRLMVHKFKDRGSFIKFYGQRTEGLLQDESIVRMYYMEANLMRREPWKITFGHLQFNCEKFTRFVIAQEIWNTSRGPRFKPCKRNLCNIFFNFLPKFRLWFHFKFKLTITLCNTLNHLTHTPFCRLNCND